MNLTISTLNLLLSDALLCCVNNKRSVSGKWHKQFGELHTRFCKSREIDYPVNSLDYVNALKREYELMDKRSEFNRLASRFTIKGLMPFMIERTKNTENKCISPISVYSYQVAVRGKINTSVITEPEQWNYILVDGIYQPFEKL